MKSQAQAMFGIHFIEVTFFAPPTHNAASNEMFDAMMSSFGTPLTYVQCDPSRRCTQVRKWSSRSGIICHVAPTHWHPSGCRPPEESSSG